MEAVASTEVETVERMEAALLEVAQKVEETRGEQVVEAMETVI